MTPKQIQTKLNKTIKKLLDTQKELDRLAKLDAFQDMQSIGWLHQEYIDILD